VRSKISPVVRLTRTRSPSWMASEASVDSKRGSPRLSRSGKDSCKTFCDNTGDPRCLQGKRRMFPGTNRSRNLIGHKNVTFFYFSRKLRSLIFHRVSCKYFWIGLIQVAGPGQAPASRDLQIVYRFREGRGSCLATLRSVESTCHPADASDSCCSGGDPRRLRSRLRGRWGCGDRARDVAGILLQRVGFPSTRNGRRPTSGSS